MIPSYAIVAALPGLLLGSFLNVCIARLPRHRSIVRPGSRCPACGHAVRPWDNIPILSWLLLRGRCRDCGARISLRYPLVEAATALLFAACVLRFGWTVEAAGMAAFCFLLLGLAVMDWETMLLPDTFTLPGIVLGIAYAAVRGTTLADAARAAALSAAWAAAAAALILFIRGAYWLVRRREGLGMGDAKLLAMVAAWLGAAQTVLVLLLGVVGAALFGIALLLASARRSDRHPLKLPLGTFLCAAALFAIFFGAPIVDWYRALLP